MPAKQYLAVLVDFDNVFISLRERGFTMTYRELMQRFRAQGPILFAEAFLSPSATKISVIDGLTKAGFMAIACPMEAMRRDAVDSLIKVRAEQLLRTDTVKTIIIASRDKGFEALIPLAANLGKEVRLVDVLALETPGATASPTVPDTNAPYVFSVNAMSNGMRPNQIKKHKHCHRVYHIVRLIYAHENRKKRHYLGLKQIQEYVLQQMDRSFRTDNPVIWVAQVIQTLADSGVLKRAEDDHGRYYILNRKDPLIRSCIK